MDLLKPITNFDTDADADAGDDATRPRPRTLTVLALLVTAALVLSYFVSFPLTNALRAAEVVATPAAGTTDPRLRLMAISFVSLLVAFVLIGATFRLSSGRQMRRIDEMAD